MPVTYSIPENLNRLALHVRLASWFGCGFISPAPGTWGSLGGLVAGIPILWVLGMWGLMASIIIVCIVGLWAAEKFDHDLKTHDSKMIVIDEVAGQGIAMLAAGDSPFLILVSFALFRFFDILKPWPVSYFDQHVGGAAGVMGDDIVAGMMAAICVLGASIYVF